MPTVADLNVCLVNEDSDADAFFGLGIRIGFYLQYLAFIWVGYFFDENPIERSGAALALWLYKFSTAVALLMKISHGEDLPPVQVYVILILLLRLPIIRLPGLFFDLLRHVPPPRMLKSDISDSFASLALLLIDVGISIWFWTLGVHHTRLEIDSDCLQWGFFFVKVDLTESWFIWLNSISVVVFFLTAVAYAIQMYRCKHTKGSEHRNKHHHYRRGSTTISNFYLTFEWALSIAAIELTLRWNQVRDVNTLSTPAQIIPFAIGVGVVARIVLKPFKIFNSQTPDKTEATQYTQYTQYTQQPHIEEDGKRILNLGRLVTFVLKLFSYTEPEFRPLESYPV